MGDVPPISNEEALKLCNQRPEETKVKSVKLNKTTGN